MQLPLADGFFNITPTQWAILIVGVSVIFSIRRWRMNVLRNRNKNTPPVPRTPSPSPPPTASSNAFNLRTVTTEIQSLLADVEETARRAAAQIDNRRTRLEQLLTEADEKIKRLESLTTAAPPSPQQDASPPLSRPRPERNVPSPLATEDPAYRPVYQLADEGKSPREIGQALNRQPGEIELILALRPR